ncbi:Hypothetical protein BQ3484_415, partial [Cedratvirus A11]
LQFLEEEACPWSSKVCSGAAEGGHLHIIQWCRSRGFVWDETTCYSAAGYGHLEVLKWLHGNGWFYRLAIKFFTKHSFVKNPFGMKKLVFLLSLVTTSRLLSGFALKVSFTA